MAACNHVQCFCVLHEARVATSIGTIGDDGVRLSTRCIDYDALDGWGAHCAHPPKPITTLFVSYNPTAWAQWVPDQRRVLSLNATYPSITPLLTYDGAN